MENFAWAVVGICGLGLSVLAVLAFTMWRS